MIIKSLSRHSAGGISGLINYILDEKKTEENEKPKPYLHNFKGTTKSEWIKELYQNEAFRIIQRKDQVYFYHFILSFSDKDNDKITNEMLLKMTQKFIELRGKEGMYIAGTHYDKEHTHIHCLISGLEFRTGKAFRMTKEEFKELKIELQNFQKEQFPELENSLPNHNAGKEYITNKEYGAKTKNPKSFIKAQLAQQVKEILLQSTNQQQFLQSLREAGLHHYERGSRPYGITVNDKNYRFRGLGIEMGELENDLTQEEIALSEIEKIRNDSNLLKNKDIEPDIFG